MKNILSQIPEYIIEKYGIHENQGMIGLHTNPKMVLGYTCFSDLENIEVEESTTTITLRSKGKFHFTMWKEVQHTTMILF